jgi:hypothetical protein
MLKTSIPKKCGKLIHVLRFTAFLCMLCHAFFSSTLPLSCASFAVSAVGHKEKIVKLSYVAAAYVSVLTDAIVLAPIGNKHSAAV